MPLKFCLQYPSQIAAIFASPRLQLLLSCNPDPVVLARLFFWIQHVLTFGFREKSKNDLQTFEKFLNVLLIFSNNFQSIPVIEGFLASFLQTWDGETSAPIIYSLISCITSTNYQDLFDGILQPLHQTFFSSNTYGKLMCLSSLTKLLKNHIVNFNALQEYTKDQSKVTTSNERPKPSDSIQDANYEISITDDDEAEMSLSHTISLLNNLVRFISDLVVLGLRTEDDHQVIY